MNKKNETEFGFTFIELMITLAIAAVLLALAGPSFVDIIRSNRLATQTSHFATALNLARSEAIKRNTQVVVCKGDAGQCDSTVNWEDGWIVFADPDNDETVDAGETIRVFDALPNGYTFRVGGNLSNWVAYLPSGRSAASGTLTNDTFRLCASDAVAVEDADRSRSIILSASGRLRLDEGATACP